MPNGDISFWTKLAGIMSMAIGGPIALIKSTTLSKKEFRTEQEKCQGAIHAEIAEMRQEMTETNKKQTAWIMAIAVATGVKKEDVREL